MKVVCFRIWWNDLEMENAVSSLNKFESSLATNLTVSKWRTLKKWRNVCLKFKGIKKHTLICLKRKIKIASLDPTFYKFNKSLTKILDERVFAKNAWYQNFCKILDMWIWLAGFDTAWYWFYRDRWGASSSLAISWRTFWSGTKRLVALFRVKPETTIVLIFYLDTLGVRRVIDSVLFKFTLSLHRSWRFA